MRELRAIQFSLGVVEHLDRPCAEELTDLIGRLI